MYNQHETARIRETFWTTFGKYMAPVPSAEGSKINWINYKTGVKHIRLLLDVNGREAIAGIFITHPDKEERAFYFNRFLQLQTIFQNTVDGLWNWQEDGRDESGKPVSSIYATLPGKQITRQEDWPDIISFFKSHIIALDEFWQLVKDGFET